MLSYMEEVLPEKKKDNIENVLDTLINVEESHRTNVRFAYTCLLYTSDAADEL